MLDYPVEVPKSNSDDASAIVLVGGLGTRLGSLTADRPKPMLPVGGRPFVEYLAFQLRNAGFRNLVFASGYRSEVLRNHFGRGDRLGLDVRYSEERTPLGTGGAIRLAADLVDGDAVLVMNGDSFLDADPRTILAALSGDIIASMALTHVDDPGRYGSVEILPDGTVQQFSPRGTRGGPGFVNAGVYGLRRSAIDAIPPRGPSSFEHDVLPSLVGPRLRGLPVHGFFIDIGVPDAYRRIVSDPAALLRAVQAPERL